MDNTTSNSNSSSDYDEEMENERLRDMTDYYCDVENEALRGWDNFEYPIAEYHTTLKWQNHIYKYLDTCRYNDDPLANVFKLTLRDYMKWQSFHLSDEWFYMRE